MISFYTRLIDWYVHILKLHNVVYYMYDSIRLGEGNQLEDV